MKYINKMKVLPVAILAILFAVGSCTKDFQEMNTDPNNPTDVPAITVFTHVITNSVDHRLGAGWVNHTYTACWSQQWCKIQYIDEDRYLYRSENINDFFETPYTNYLMDLKLIMDKTKAGGSEENLGLNAAATVLWAWIFQGQTDLFGDIPYSQALQGLDPAASVFPDYDTQESIYMDLIDRLDAANTTLSDPAVAAANVGSGDVIFGGDAVEWRKFANSMRLRLLNRSAGTPGDAVPYAQADAKIAAMLADPATYPLMESNDDNAKLVYPGALPYRNGTYNTLYTRTDQAISQTMVDFLNTRNDTRVEVYAQPNGIGDYVGAQNGRASQPVMGDISLLGTAIAYDPAAPLYIQVDAEVEFIKAEYYVRAGNLVDAQTAYENGIQASFDQWGAVMPAGYLTDPLVDFSLATTTNERMQLIGEQKWAALFTQGIEAYAEVRRTGYPSRIFQYELEATNYPGLGLPVRLPYPADEDSYNPDKVKAAKTAQHIEASNDGMFSTSGITSQLWWNTRKNPIPTVTDPQPF